MPTDQTADLQMDRDSPTEISLEEIFEDSVAILRFGGGCQGCGMVDVTLKDGVEKTLLTQIPELTEVRDITDHSITENAYY